MNFISADPTDYLSKTDKTYDYVVLNNCIWYFDSPARISDLLAILVTRKHAKRILIAEWSLEAQNMKQVPHVLAALARGNLEYLNKDSSQNIRTLASPAWFRRWFEKSDVSIEQETLFAPPPAMKDGIWETSTVLSESFAAEVALHAKSEEQIVALNSMRDAVVSSVRQLSNGVKDVECMMIWAAKI